MKTSKVTYSFFVVTASGSIASAWDYKQDAKDAAGPSDKIRHVSRIDKNVLKKYLEDNKLVLLKAAR